MSLRRFSLISLIAISLGATSALADNVAAPHEVKPKASKAKGARPAPPTSDLGNIKFSDPSAPVVGEAKTKPAVPSDAKGVAAQPNGGVSLELKWHATNDRPDPFDGVTHTSGPNGPGDAVLGGVKLGF
jgi:hypothetical protein